MVFALVWEALIEGIEHFCSELCGDCLRRNHGQHLNSQEGAISVNFHFSITYFLLGLSVETSVFIALHSPNLLWKSRNWCHTVDLGRRKCSFLIFSVGNDKHVEKNHNHISLSFTILLHFVLFIIRFWPNYTFSGSAGYKVFKTEFFDVFFF